MPESQDHIYQARRKLTDAHVQENKENGSALIAVASALQSIGHTLLAIHAELVKANSRDPRTGNRGR